MFVKILLIVVLAILLLPKLFERIFSMIFSRDMSATIIEAVESGVDYNFPFQKNVLKKEGNPIWNGILDMIQTTERALMRILLYSLITLMFLYIIFVAIAPVILIAYNVRL